MPLLGHDPTDPTDPTDPADLTDPTDPTDLFRGGGLVTRIAAIWPRSAAAPRSGLGRPAAAGGVGSAGV